MIKSRVVGLVCVVLPILIAVVLARPGWADSTDPTGVETRHIWVAMLALMVLLLALALALALALGSIRNRMRGDGRARGRHDRLSVLVARLGDDPGDACRTRVGRVLRHELGSAVQVIFLPDALSPRDGDAAEDAGQLHVTAQGWLRRRNCDLLVWGRVRADEVAALRFTPCDGSGRAETAHRPTETLDLPGPALAELGAVLATRILALAAPAVDEAPSWLVPRMRTLAARLHPLANGLPAAFDAPTRGQILHAYALARHTLGSLGDREEDLEDAVAAFRAALEVRTRDTVPLDWAMTQNSLGNVLLAQGEGDEGTAPLLGAVAAFRAALEVLTPATDPPGWAMAQGNLGIALQILGEREDGTERLTEAVAAFRSALQVWTRATDPLDWATTQNNLGTALATLGEREEGTARLMEAVAACRAALEVRTRARHPIAWARTTENVAILFLTLAERTGDAAAARAAVAAYLDCLDVYRAGDADACIEKAEDGLAWSRVMLARLGGGRQPPAGLIPGRAGTVAASRAKGPPGAGPGNARPAGS